ncbi:YheC/YheD family protein [Aneurinibacillus sp. Ricciae_BoGa-3]|uniref:YheC/YheD family endospore coat-associated protein n=1 Tax=Aneurinibacillus sp. Ricciae_BoGa-3 TaxID=3022697 RepID=UPI002341871D|nr:YheC/YheD family protein [Aneurinibacillus sp. Ricciae_BoGa-3]WCK55499.1 YheC/YheD family protein [Aneurinibacillus sp. Ricciae_BoGa-3]
MAEQAQPALGILVAGLSITEAGPFGIITSFCREVVQACQAKGKVAYIFTLDQIPSPGTTIAGWTYRGGQWASTSFPLPVCVYNRIGSRGMEARETTRQKIEWLKQQGVIFFNEQFLDKWQIHKRLKNTEIGICIPETDVFDSLTTLLAYLKKYPVVYLKPVHGSLGRRIIRLSRSKGTYVCEHTSASGDVVRKKFNSSHALYTWITKIKGKRKFVIQQGIPLIRHREAIVDFRALVQKNRYGSWSITSMVGRCGPANSIVSNIARGGRLITLTESLAHAHKLPFNSEDLSARIKQKALQIARVFEQHVEGKYAELGIDLGLDTMGKIWLIEINSKPSKNDTSVPYLQKGPRRSVTRLVNYSLYLGGYVFPRRKKRRQG